MHSDSSSDVCVFASASESESESECVECCCKGVPEIGGGSSKRRRDGSLLRRRSPSVLAAEQERSKQRMLIHLWHCKTCPCTGAGPGSCVLGVQCVDGKRLIAQAERPARQHPDDEVRRCAEVMAHQRSCRDSSCTLCQPLRVYVELKHISAMLHRLHTGSSNALHHLTRIMRCDGGDGGYGGGNMYVYMANVYIIHLRTCTDAMCPVPMCTQLKARLKANRHQQPEDDNSHSSAAIRFLNRLLASSE